MSHKRSKAAPKAAQERAVQFDPKVMEALVPGTLTAEEANALFAGFKKAVFERALACALALRMRFAQPATVALRWQRLRALRWRRGPAA